MPTGDGEALAGFTGAAPRALPRLLPSCGRPTAPRRWSGSPRSGPGHRRRLLRRAARCWTACAPERRMTGDRARLALPRPYGCERRAHLDSARGWPLDELGMRRRCSSPTGWRSWPLRAVHSSARSRPRLPPCRCRSRPALHVVDGVRRCSSGTWGPSTLPPSRPSTRSTGLLSRRLWACARRRVRADLRERFLPAVERSSTARRRRRVLVIPPASGWPRRPLGETPRRSTCPPPACWCCVWKHRGGPWSRLDTAEQSASTSPRWHAG